MHKKDKKKTLKFIKDRFENQLDDAKDEIKEILKELRQEKSEKIARRSYARLAELEKTEQISIPSCYKFINERIYGLAKIIFLQYTKQNQ